mgnify:CR=1 FL=1
MQLIEMISSRCAALGAVRFPVLVRGDAAVRCCDAAAASRIAAESVGENERRICTS